MILAPLLLDHPWAQVPRRIMAHVLIVAAGKLGHPVVFVITVVTDDCL